MPKHDYLVLDVQLASDSPELCPSLEDLTRWCNLAMQTELSVPTDLTLRFVDAEESQELNKAYRGKDKPTNVLSFPFINPIDLPSEAGLNLLGDLVICVPLVQQEALEQGKPLLHHWAHLVIHGMLHLQGFDHDTEIQAQEMEGIEIQLLEQMDIPNPYLST